MGFFDRFLGRGRDASAARAAELRGDLATAAELFGRAGLPEEAARVMILRAAGETDPRAKLQFLAQAGQLAPAGTAPNAEARRKRAELLLALAGDVAVSAIARHEVLEAARDLEEVGASLEAASAYERAGDKEGEARALQAAGDVERLEFLLATEHHKERLSRARGGKAQDIELMIACGKRREALTTIEELLRDSSENRSAHEDAPLRERAAGLRARRVLAPRVVIEVLGERWNMVLGHEIVVGRTEGSIHVPSNAVSRTHLRIARDGGEIVVRDMGSRNGTQLRGINVAGALPIRDGLELKLGREVTFRVQPSTRLKGAVEIEVGGERYVAPLGEAVLHDLGLELAVGDGDWVELVTRRGRAFAGDVEWTDRATLLAGDALSTARRGEPELRVVST